MSRVKVSKITPKIENSEQPTTSTDVLVNESSKEAKTSHAVAANLSELELKKILIDKMEANNSINRSDTQRQLYKALVDAYEADKILLDTYGDTVTIKRPRDGADDDQEPSAGTDRGSKRRRSGKEPESTSAPREKTTTTAGKTTTGSKTHKQSASQSAPVEETMQSTDVFEAPAHQEFETGVHDEQAEEEVHHLPDWDDDILTSAKKGDFPQTSDPRHLKTAASSRARKILNLTKPDTKIQFDKTRQLTHHTSLPEDSIYENKDKKSNDSH
ncbi:hypothetical protein Tco_0892271 [Tanacetum coccineum]|uniref:Uncharacterized protein n=1 Tax=Tanacetum coccineum TaxID=301880 RepID=A0ABQ5CAT9_9ASTR